MPLREVPLRIGRIKPLQAATGSAKFGVCSVDFTPPKGFDMAGYSLAGKRSRGAATRLEAFAMYFDDGKGHAAAWVVADAHSASRYILEKAASLTAASTPIGVENLLLSGTHTHTGPGQFYGNGLYDLVATPFALSNHPGFRAEIADSVASAIAHAVRGAFRSAQRVNGTIRIGIGESVLWGVSHNRSAARIRKPDTSGLGQYCDDAFHRNPEAADWPKAIGLAGPVSPTRDPTVAHVDPRVRVLTVLIDGELFSAHASFGCHATSLGPNFDRYHHDWPGFARATARKILWPSGTGHVSVALSAAGDSNAFVDGVEPSEGLAETVGTAVGQAIAHAAGNPLNTIPLDEVEARFVELDTSVKVIEGNPCATLANHWALGWPTLGGSEESKTSFYSEGKSGDDFEQSDPQQHPKASAEAIFGTIIPGIFGRVAPSPVWPVTALRIGSHWLIGIPFEPTTVAFHRIELELSKRLSPPQSHWVVGYSGDYSGYLTTPEEFEAQNYEGSSNLWGKGTLPHLIHRVVGFVSNVPKTPNLGEVAMKTLVREEFDF